MGHNSADYLHVMTESKKLAYADRAMYYADPDFGFFFFFSFDLIQSNEEAIISKYST